MRLPKDILSNTYTKPRFFLCETDKQRICALETIGATGSFKFNSYSEISFEVARVYNDIITGNAIVNPYYNKIEALRLIEVEGFGFFEIQTANISSDGIQEKKTVTAYSLEYTLSQKYLEDFYTASAKDWTGSLEDIWQQIKGNEETVPVIVLYNPEDRQASLLHLILEKIYGWRIGHVDASLQNLSREINVDRQSVYDFIMNEICKKFNCYTVFDTIENTINVYAESLTAKFIGDGATNTFVISPPFYSINTVAVGGYKTSQYEYDSTTGILTLTEVPANGKHIEVVDGALEKWQTDVYVTFDNLSKNMNVDYDNESIKTVLSVSYGDDNNIREVNLGLPYIVDLSYYYTPEWMGQDLYDAYTRYLQKCNDAQNGYVDNVQERTELSRRIWFEKNRLALDYSHATVSDKTNGTYYIRGGDYPDYYYQEVNLPYDYVAGTQYYSMRTTNLNEDKVNSLYSVLQMYYNWENADKSPNWENELDELVRDFAFMEAPRMTLEEFKEGLKARRVDKQDRKTEANKAAFEEMDRFVAEFLSSMWKELGKDPLEKLYLEPFKKRQLLNMSVGEDKDGTGKDENGNAIGSWALETSENYWLYYPVTIMIKTLEDAVAERKKVIDRCNAEINNIIGSIGSVADSLLIANNFTEKQLVRLNAFLREDEIKIEEVIETDLDTDEQILKNKRDAMESARIELQKISQPKLKFTMDMANIYALPEFEPIVGQFQLGNAIKVALRDDYVKQSRLMAVTLQFDDFSSLSCEFGDLTSMRTQSDIHADLLKQAVQAGQSVATNASYWSKGSDVATRTDLKLENGLLDAITQIKSMDGTQNLVMDKYGIRLQREQEPGSIDPRQVWMVNNQILFTDDNFQTCKTALGEIKVDKDQYMYGLLADAVISGYIEGSKMVGGTIKIGEMSDGRPVFEVDQNGNVFMLGGEVEFRRSEDGAISNPIKDIQEAIKAIDVDKYSVDIESYGGNVITTKENIITLNCKVMQYGADITGDLDASIFHWRRVSPTAVTYIGDGTTNSFKLPDNFGAAYIDDNQIKNTEFSISQGNIMFSTTPHSGSVIEIVDIKDLAWNSDHNRTKTVSVTCEDIESKANFNCVVDLPEEERQGE